MKKAVVIRATSASLAAAALLCAGAATAESIGYLGLSYGNNTGSNPNDGDRETSHSVTIDGAFAYRFGGNHTLAFEALYRDDTYTPDITDDDLMEAQHQIGLHYLYHLNGGLIVGAFGAYGEAPHADPGNEDYKVIFGGLQTIYDTGKDVVLFAQVGRGDSPGGEDLSSFGYFNAEFFRLGATYTGFERTTVTFDFEKSYMGAYEGDDEPGNVITASLSGQTSLRNNSNWVATYGVRLANFDALNDDDYVNETTINIGMRYTFGANQPRDLTKAGLIGLPYSPLRASAWTPAMD